MTKVYVLTSGSYSDYHIIGIFSTKERAEFISKKLDSNNEIEEYELDEIGKDNRFVYDCYFGKDGIDVAVIDQTWSTYKLNIVDDFRSKQWHQSNFVVSVLAEDEEHAIKIAFDLIAIYKYNHD